MRWSLRLCYERAIALIILLNVGLVLFDATYVKSRYQHLWVDWKIFQWQHTPQEDYVQLVEQLNQAIAQDGLGALSTAALLAQVQSQSLQLLVTDPPFRLWGRFSHLSQIQKVIIDETELEDLKAAIAHFWSLDFIQKIGWETHWTLFNLELRPLLLAYEPVLDYDFIKGIEPDRGAQDYLREFAKLKAILQWQGADSDLLPPQLDKLQHLTELMLAESFSINLINKSGKINQMNSVVKTYLYSQEPPKERELINSQLQLNKFRSPWVIEWIAPELLWADLSSKAAFQRFWSINRFQKDNWQKNVDFFDEKIYFIIESMYFRHLEGSGDFANRFFLVDFPFLLIYWIDFICKVCYRFYREKEIGIGTAIGSRSYDILLLQPWVPGLRVLPLIIRFNQSDLIDLEPVTKYLGLNFIASFGQEIAQVVFNRGIGQLQNQISGGLIQKALIKTHPHRHNPEEASTPDRSPKQRTLGRITERIWEVTACNVLPEISPDLEAFLHYKVDKVIRQSSWYQRLQKLPGLRRLPDQLTQKLVQQVIQALTLNPRQSYLKGQTQAPDGVEQQLKNQLVANFRAKLQVELQKNYTLEEVELLLVEILEGAKIGGSKSSQPQLKPANLPPEKIPQDI